MENWDILNQFETLTEEELMNITGGGLPENLREERIKLGWTQEQLANKLYICPQAVHNYETGIRTPNVFILKDMAGIFSTTMDSLMRDNPMDSSIG